MEVVAKTIRLKKTKSSVDKAILLTGLAVFFIGGGFLAPLFGLVFIVVHSFLTNDTIFSGIGSVLMIISIPMLLIGSHLMDLADRKW